MRILLFAVLILGLGFASCKKCADCACTNQVSYTFGSNVDDATRESIRNQTDAAFDTNNPETSEEICDRGDSFESAKTEYEDASYTQSFDNPGGLDYSYTFNRNCVCEDQ